jgi:Fe-S cluster biogenesis protein NfuA/nitrite reductase/ring-hydroxylating ferredoxin subunit
MSASAPLTNEKSPDVQHRSSQRKERIDAQALQQIDAMNQAGSRIQELVEKLDALLDPAARAMFQECMESVLNFYGLGLSRVLQITEDAEPEGRRIYNAIVHDSVLRGLLLIHDLHPADLETRLQEALSSVRPYLESHGGNVELVSLQEDVARLRLEGTCKSCASSAVTLELAVKHAIEEACPDLVRLEVEGVPEGNGPNGAFVPKQSVATRWIAIDGIQQLGPDAGAAVRVGGMRLVVFRASDNFYAYRDKCPGCNMPLDPNSLTEGTIRCGLGHKYSVREAGRSADSLKSHLDPVPLIVHDREVKVAVPFQANET